MSAQTTALYTAVELAAEATLHLAEVDQRSGRVRQAISLRALRYYNTHGLLDPPARFHGRTALYGHHHLLQLVAIKRLQARGCTLVEVQQQLLGLSDAALAQVAGLAPGEQAPRPEDPGAFWETIPEAPAPAEATEEAAPLEALRLDEGAVLLLEGLQRTLHPDDVEALRAAAAPMLKLLRARQLLPRSTEVSR